MTDDRRRFLEAAAALGAGALVPSVRGADKPRDDKKDKPDTSTEKKKAAEA